MKKCILTIGMHRSGASAIAGLLERLGVEFGKNTMGLDFDNPPGSYEHRGIVNVNEDIIRSLGGSWDNIPDISDGWFLCGDALRYKEKIGRMIAQDFNGYEIFGIKDPRISVLLPLYIDILDDLRIKPFYVIAIRKEIEVCRSLGARGGIPLNRSIALYDKYMEAIERATKDKDKMYIYFEDVIDDPLSVASRIKQRLILPAGIDASLEKKIYRFINPGLRHHCLESGAYLRELISDLENKNATIERLDPLLKEKESALQRCENLLTDRDIKINNLNLIFKEKKSAMQRLEFLLGKKEAELFSLSGEIQNIKSRFIWSLMSRYDRAVSFIFPGDTFLKKMFVFATKSLQMPFKKFLPKEKTDRAEGSQGGVTAKRRQGRLFAGSAGRIAGRRRILFVNHEESRTGAPRLLFEIAKGMKDRFDIVMVSLAKGSMHEDFRAVFKNILYPEEYLRGLSLDKGIIQLLKRVNPDLVYGNTFRSGDYIYYAKKLGISTILHTHELEWDIRYDIGQTGSKVFRNRPEGFVDTVIAVSENIRDLLIRRYNFNTEKIKLIHGFIDSGEVLRKARAGADDPIRRNDGEIILAAVGTVCTRKGIDILIEAHNILKKRGHQKYKIVWIGEHTEFTSEVSASLRKRGEDFLLLGEKNNPFSHMRAADIFVLPSRQDPFPLVVLEAMALGKPIIVFRQSGGAHKAVEGCCGIVVDEAGPEPLADAIISLSSNNELMKKFSREGPLRQKGEYDSRVVMGKIEAVLREAIENRKIVRK
ncbi:glycosyltransferase [Candidatus Omnitrophota bacterium]